jgi:hypothetical protein
MSPRQGTLVDGPEIFVGDWENDVMNGEGNLSLDRFIRSDGRHFD